MKTFVCTCNNTLYFENSQCLRCGAEVGWCPACADLVALNNPAQATDGSRQCGQCGAGLRKCTNFSQYDVCNRCLLSEDVVSGAAINLCDYCRFNETIPDLTVEGNLRRWYELETAKRRLLYTLDRLGLPIVGTTPPLSFDFKGDEIVDDRLWRTMGEGSRVYTGHAGGKITINIEEADDDVREKLRVDLNESHRTVVGHFRHEIGHFYWEMLVRGPWLPKFVSVFGNHEKPTYAEALETYYQNGPKSGWPHQYISAYATMHPWEDFAESFAAYLDMVSAIDTADQRTGVDNVDVRQAGFDEMLHAYTQLGVMLNELNRTMGLKDFLPDVFTPAVRGKLRFVHDLLRDHAEHSRVH